MRALLKLKAPIVRACASRKKGRGRNGRSSALVRQLAILQTSNQRAQKHLIESQLAGGGNLLEERGAHLARGDIRGRADGRGTLSALHVARLAKAVARV